MWTDRAGLEGDSSVCGNSGYQSASDMPLGPGKLFQAFVPGQPNVLVQPHCDVILNRSRGYWRITTRKF